MKDDGFNLRRLTIPLTVHDYDPLYQIQQCYLFSGKSIGNVWQLGDIFKATIFYAGMKMLQLSDKQNEEAYRQFIPFLDRHQIPHSLLPKTAEEFLDRMKKHTTEEMINTTIKYMENGQNSNDNEIYELLNKLKESKANKNILNEPGDSFSSNKATNFTIALTNEARSVFTPLKSYIEAYVGEITNVEMVRTMFRANTLPQLTNADLNGKDWTHKSEEYNRNTIHFISIIYSGSLYDISPPRIGSTFLVRKPFFTTN